MGHYIVRAKKHGDGNRKFEYAYSLNKYCYCEYGWFNLSIRKYAIFKFRLFHHLLQDWCGKKLQEGIPRSQLLASLRLR
jgi:hypothetical protein